MIRFRYVTPSERVYWITVIEMDNGTFYAYASTGCSNRREIRLEIEPSRYEVARAMIRGGAAALERAGDAFSLCQTMAPGGPLEQIGRNLAEVRIWTEPGKRTAFPQPLAFFLDQVERERVLSRPQQ